MALGLLVCVLLLVSLERNLICRSVGWWWDHRFLLKIWMGMLLDSDLLGLFGFLFWVFGNFFFTVVFVSQLGLLSFTSFDAAFSLRWILFSLHSLIFIFF